MFSTIEAFDDFRIAALMARDENMLEIGGIGRANIGIPGGGQNSRDTIETAGPGPRGTFIG